MVIISNNFSIYSYICSTTLSGRPGGYSDDDLIKLKKTKKKHVGFQESVRGLPLIGREQKIAVEKSRPRTSQLIIGRSPGTPDAGPSESDHSGT